MSTVEFNTHLVGHRKALEYFAISLCDNREDARDLMQDTFLKAIVYRDKFRDATNLKAWLYTIMKNTFINSYRRKAKARKLMVKTDDLPPNALRIESRETNPAAQLGASEAERVVSELQSEYRVPFTMHHEGFKYHEIAESLSLPIGTVKSRIFMARQKLMGSLIETPAA